MKPVQSFKGQTVLITGPTAGIGRDLADLFAAEGADLILVSRNVIRLNKVKEELESAYKVRAHVIPADLALTGASGQLIAAVERANLTVDALVNNAGYGVYGKFLDEDITAQLGMIELHVAAPTRLTHAFLPGMVARKRGGVLNISSTGGFQPVAIENVYCATKAYLTHFTEALAEELDGTGSGVSVTCVCPGPTETSFFDNPHMKTRAPAKLSRMTSKAVARLAFDAFKQGKILEVTGLQNKLIAFATKIAPRAAVRKAARRIVERSQITRPASP
jgi:hypothetical protein